MARNSVSRLRDGISQLEREVERREHYGRRKHRAQESAARGYGWDEAELFARLVGKNSEIGGRTFVRYRSLDCEMVLEWDAAVLAPCRRECCWQRNWPPTCSQV